MEETRMKKIVALVLGLALALSLCTVAFAANFSGSYTTMDTSNKATATDTLNFVEASTGVVAHYTDGTKNYLQVGSLAQADKVVYAADGKTVVMYLAEIVPNYDGKGTVFANFGKKCGQVNFTPASGKTYYTAVDANGDDLPDIYVADPAGAKALMVGNVLTRVSVAVANYTEVAHTAAPVVTDGKITGYKCSVCGLNAVEAPNFASIPAGAQNFTGNWYFPAAAGTAAAGTTAGVASPKTFDAGIAMYAGLALMSVAGSAVVIGKKKEF